MINYIEILKILGLAFIITKFEPINWLLDLVRPKNKYIRIITSTIQLALTCMPCASFWIGLFGYGIWHGILSYFISYLWTKTISKTLDKNNFQ